MMWKLSKLNFPHKNDATETLNAIQVSMNESRERIARLRAKREFLEKVIPPSFFDNNDEDIKMIRISPIE